MFIIVNRIGDSITGSVNGKAFGVKYNEERYKALKQYEQAASEVASVEELNAIIEAITPLTKESYKELVETSTPYLFVNEAKGTYHLKVGNGTDAKISSEPLPQPFVDRVLKSVEQGIDVLPLVKAWARFLRNPNYTREKAYRFANYINHTYTDRPLVDELMDKEGVAYEVAVERATTFQTPITKEGLICTYKVSEEVSTKWVLDENGNKKQVSRFGKEIDEETGEVSVKKPDFVEDRVFRPAVQGDSGDAFYCGDKLGHVIKVGSRHRLENWNQVDCNDARSCVKGLHTGNLDYIRGYQTKGTETHNVFVDPMNIGAITDDGSGALRVLEYFVHSSFAGVNRSIYHSSKYAAITDKAYLEMFEEAVKTRDQQKAAEDEQWSELEALKNI